MFKMGVSDHQQGACRGLSKIEFLPQRAYIETINGEAVSSVTRLA
jgi:hypothetical protein